MKMSKVFLAIILSAYFQHALIGQDSTKIIIINEKIGPIVDLNEKAEYNLLPNFGNEFVSAKFYLSQDSLYKCDIVTNNGIVVKDTTIVFSFNAIRNIAIKIKYTDNIKKGITDYNYTNLKLNYADNTVVEKIEKTIDKEIENTKSTYEQNSRNFYRLPTNRLNLNYEKIIERKFTLGLSLGMGFSTNNYSGIDILYKKVEEKLNLPSRLTEFTNGALFKISSFLVTHTNIVFNFNYSFNFVNETADECDVSIANFSIGYLYPIIEKTNLYTSLGLSSLAFRTRVHYNFSTENGYLEYIDMNGNNKGLRIEIGVLSRLTSIINLNLSVAYYMYPQLRLTNTQDVQLQNKPNIYTNNFEFGLNFYFY